MHPQTNARRIHEQTDKADCGSACDVTTLEELGRYLQKLRENRRVTQTSLSTKTGAIAGYKISRSRISEIENARRDRIAERELRGYLLGLKCTPRHIDQMVKALRQCTATRPWKSSPDPTSTSSTTSDSGPVGLSGVEDKLMQQEEQPDNSPTARSDENEVCDHLSQAGTCIDSHEASRPQPPRRRWQRHHIELIVATALVIATFTGFNAAFFLRRENVELLMLPSSPPPSTSPPGSTTALLGSPDAPLVPEDTSDFSKNVTSSSRAHVRIDKRRAKLSEIRNRLAPENNTSHATIQQVGHCCFVLQQGHLVGPAALPRVDQHWYRYAAESDRP